MPPPSIASPPEERLSPVWTFILSAAYPTPAVLTCIHHGVTVKQLGVPGTPDLSLQRRSYVLSTNTRYNDHASSEKT